MFEKFTEEDLLYTHSDTHIKMSKELCAFNNTLCKLESHLKDLEKLGEENISIDSIVYATDLIVYDNVVDNISSDTIFLRASYINICNVANALIDEDGEIYKRILNNLREDVKREEYTNEQLKQVLKNLE